MKMYHNFSWEILFQWTLHVLIELALMRLQCNLWGPQLGNVYTDRVLP